MSPRDSNPTGLDRHEPGPVWSDADSIVFDDVSKFYGEVLGVNRVSLRLEPGITGLVGPNGSGKSTLMNLMTGLLRPSEGEVRVLGLPTDEPDPLLGQIGYLGQYDSFPVGATGRSFVAGYLRLYGYSRREAGERADAALAQVGLTEAADRRAAGFSKGMRQRLRLAQAVAHEPRILILDEPLNGLDPQARSQVIEVFKGFADEGRHVVVSSHILHEIDVIADRVVLLTGGYVVAEGEVQGVRSEMNERPIQVLIRCDRARWAAARLFEDGSILEATINDDEGGLLARTRTASRLYRRLNRLVLDDDLRIETVSLADSDVRAVYSYLIESEGSGP